ncbi:MAG: helix-turn-helix domain-containing protein [Bacteroides sp.]|nr:helix-turn-helix domain-containing protein [Bacteroides sp.]
MITTTIHYTIALLVAIILFFFFFSLKHKKQIKKKEISHPYQYNEQDHILQEIQSNIIQTQYLKENDWHTLRDKVNDIYPHFTDRIMIDFPNLSKDDLRIILLLRIGISHKEIARLCNIQLSSFRKRRNRLKQKMNIQCDSISQYIKEMYIAST